MNKCLTYIGFDKCVHVHIVFFWPIDVVPKFAAQSFKADQTSTWQTHIDPTLEDMISMEIKDLGVPQRDFLRYLPDSRGNPLGLPFYTESLTSELKTL